MPLSQLLFSSNGRIRRSTYWYFSLAYGGISLVLSLVSFLLTAMATNSGDGSPSTILTLIALLFSLFVLAVSLFGIFTAIMVGIKRCHDRDRSGWFLLVSLVPFLNLWPFIELGFLAGTPGPNRFGPDPKQPQSAPQMISY